MLRYLAVLLWLPFFFACTRVKPEEPISNTEYSELKNEVSYVKIPISYETKQLEELINRKIRGVVYQDLSFDNNNRDNLKIKITKVKRINVSAEGQYLYYNLPVKVWVEKKVIGTKKLFGKELFKKGNEVEFALEIYCRSKVDINKDWKLSPKTTYTGLRWIERPRATFLKIDLSKMVERKLEEQMGELLVKFDQNIHDNLDLKSKVKKVWTDLQKPILVNKKLKKIWIKSDPFEVAASEIHAKEGKLTVDVEIGTYLYTLTGEQSVYTVNEELPSLRNKRNFDRVFDLNLLCKIEFDDINNVLKQNLKGKEISVQDRKIKIRGAKVYGSDHQIILELKIKGAVRGTVFFRGKPHFDSLGYALSLEDFDFDIETEEVLLNVADWLLHEEFKEKIQNELYLPLQEQVSQLPLLIHRGVEKGKAGKKIDIAIQEMHLQPKEMLVTSKDLQMLINAKGEVALELSNL